VLLVCFMLLLLLLLLRRRRLLLLLLLLLLLCQGMEAELGVEAAGEISFEVSSPGAERTLIIPQDLLRFKVSKLSQQRCCNDRTVVTKPSCPLQPPPC